MAPLREVILICSWAPSFGGLLFNFLKAQHGIAFSLEELQRWNRLNNHFFIALLFLCSSFRLILLWRDTYLEIKPAVNSVCDLA